ncbi:MAG: hypothetical protein WBD05_02870 [Phycisphaerae bacterium]
MRHLVLVLAVVAVASLMVMGCQKSAHDRFRDWTYRRVTAADQLGIADDADAIFLNERPTHLAPWYHH